MMSIHKPFILIILWLCAAPLLAQERTVDRTLLFGVGHLGLLDTYLSPQNYDGTAISATLLTERKARWAKTDRVSVIGRFDIYGGYAKPASENSTMWDAQLTLGGGLRYNWQINPHLRLAAGGILELTGGGTYHDRNGNNPAQGRVAADLAASVQMDYAFRVKNKDWHLRVLADAPLLGAMFTPNYGQSYYEIFELKHTNGNVRFTYPGNVPTARLMTTLTIPLGRARLVVGYQGDIRQSHVADLKRHAWRNEFIVGFTRTLSIK